MRHGHEKSDLRNLRLHEAALENLRCHPEKRDLVVALIDRWLEDDALRASSKWLLEWREMLTEWPFETMRTAVLDRDGGQTLRQCSPLAPLLKPQERWAVLRRVEQELARAEIEPH